MIETNLVEMQVDAQQRADNCIQDIKMVEKKWNCKIEPFVQITGQGVQTGYSVVPLMNVVIQ